MGEIDLRKGLCMGIDFILVTSIVVTRFNIFYFRAQIRLLAISNKFLPIVTKSVIVIST